MIEPSDVMAMAWRLVDSLGVLVAQLAPGGIAAKRSPWAFFGKDGPWKCFTFSNQVASPYSTEKSPPASVLTRTPALLCEVTAAITLPSADMAIPVIGVVEIWFQVAPKPVVRKLPWVQVCASTSLVSPAETW